VGVAAAPNRCPQLPPLKTALKSPVVTCLVRCCLGWKCWSSSLKVTKSMSLACISFAAAGDTLAMLYNDTSVLENHHCTVAFRLMQKEGCNVLESFGRKKYHGVRRIIVDLARLFHIILCYLNIYIHTGGYVFVCLLVGLSITN